MGSFGAILGRPGAILGHPATTLGHLGAILEHLGAIWGQKMGISIETSPISWIPGDKDEPIARDVSHLSARWTNTYLKTYIKTYIKIYIKVRGRLSPQASWIRPRT